MFIAVWPPADVIATIAALRRDDEPGLRFIPPENWHVTLRFFGDADAGEVAAAIDGAPYPAATARLGPTVGIIARSALAIPVRGLDALATEVSTRTATIGQPVRTDFRGHLTIARWRARKARPSVRGARVDAQFDVEEITLVRSHLDRDGASYERLISWKVGPGC